MANPNNNGGKKGAAAEASEGEVVNLAPEGFVALNLDRQFYSPQATKMPLQGYLIASETMHSPQLQRDFEAVIVRTTAATECIDGNKQLQKVDAGSDLILVVTSSLKKLLTLTGKDLVPEISIQHAGKRQIGGGKTLNTYKAFITPPETWKKRTEVAPDTLGDGTESFGFTLPAAGGEKQLTQ